ncbi:MAG: site-specific tyrosine recombinase XerC [Gemmatimonadaceae bacterium]
MTSATTGTLAAAIAAHLAARAATGNAPATVARCQTHLARFATWCEARSLTRFEALTPAILERYQEWLANRRQPDGRPLAWSTQAHELTAVRMLCAWAVRTKRLVVNPAADLDLPRQPKRLPRAVLSVSEAERVLAAPDVATLLGLRDRAILEVLYSTGLRRMEVIGLDVTDLDAERGVVFVREGKGKKDRLVPIGERAIRWTTRYLDHARPQLVRHGERCDALFLSRRGTRIRPTRLTERLHRYVTASGVAKPGSVHLFRHTMATLMHDAGCDIRDLQAMLGHAQLSTTEIYTHVSIERLKAVHAKTHPAHLLTHLPEVAHDRTPASSSLAAEGTTTAATGE